MARQSHTIFRCGPFHAWPGARLPPGGGSTKPLQSPAGAPACGGGLDEMVARGALRTEAGVRAAGGEVSTMSVTNR